MENLTHSKFQKVPKSKFGWNFNIMDGLGCVLKIFKQDNQKRPELSSKIMIIGLSSPQWSKWHGNCIIMDVLGWILKIFKQTHQKRPEDRVDLRGHQTNKVKMISIQF